MSWTLALDTATPATVAAAVAPDGRSAARIESPEVGVRPAHTARLLALAEDALHATGGDWSGVTRIVVGLGPGTFTGIRVGVATARAAALASGAAVVGVPTPAALAQAARSDGAEGPILVVQDARRGEWFLTLVAAGDVARQAAGLRPWTCPRNELEATVAGLEPRPAVAVGDGAVAHREGLTALGVAVPDDPQLHRVDGVALAAVAATTAPAADGDVRPVYAREPDAIPTAERR